MNNNNNKIIKYHKFCIKSITHIKILPRIGVKCINYDNPKIFKALNDVAKATSSGFLAIKPDKSSTKIGNEQGSFR